MSRSDTKVNRIGETMYNKYNSKMTIVNYNNNQDITVKFENGYIVNSTYQQFKNKNIKSPYDKSVFNVGFSGEGDYKTNIDGIPSIQYRYWNDMIRRSFSDYYKENHPTYKDVSCCNEWLNFQNFAKWFDANYYKIDDEKMNLDKDILVKGNKIYSPDACIFAPERINTLITNCFSSRGDFPIGVHLCKSGYHSQCSVIEDGKIKRKHLGFFDTPEKAFYRYKNFKEHYIKQVANKYKGRIPDKLYNAIYNWEIEIMD